MPRRLDPPPGRRMPVGPNSRVDNKVEALSVFQQSGDVVKKEAPEWDNPELGGQSSSSIRSAHGSSVTGY